MSISKFTRIETAGFVYFLELRNGTGIKIGKTKRIEKRLAEHRQKFDFEVIQVIYTEDCNKIESMFHEHFNDKKIDGEREIFHLDENEVDQIKKMNFPSNIVESLDLLIKNEREQDKIDFNIIFGELTKQLVDEVDSSREEILFKHIDKISELNERIDTSLKLYPKFENLIEKGKAQVLERGIALDEKEKQLFEKFMELEERESKLKLKEDRIKELIEKIKGDEKALRQREIEAEKELEITRKYLAEAERYLSWEFDSRLKHYIDQVKQFPQLKEYLHYSDPWRNTEYKGINKHTKENFEGQTG
ncbi:GIY-YIG nuclease family protein [Bacillus marasmi]|uniref:GIY-YIG nuclease family protein n=1 Tax=Bacillus marasmi TaxID=1926279 RepID=UPI001FE33F98|nr:GIY-YIG nuclease family protein [Bacillus marasmi]